MPTAPTAEPAPAEAPVSKGRRRGAREIENPVYLSARVPKALRDDFQRRAITEGRKIGVLLEDAVREYLDRHSDQPKQ